MLKAFYGRYYNNLADGFSAANPAGQRYVEYNFNDLNRNGKYDGVSELGTFRTRLGGADAPVDPNLKTPHTDEISFTIERQFWQESSIRATYVRKMQRDFVPFYFTPIVTAWVGNLTVPKTAVVNGVTYNLLDVPNSLANATDTAYTNYPNSNFNYDTVEVAFQKRFGAGLFFQASGDLSVARRAAFGRHPRRRLDQPAEHRSDRRLPAAVDQRDGAEPSEDDEVRRAALWTLLVQVRRRHRPELPVPERLPVLARSFRTARSI